jgi:RimJ/RimL family protein N-acetyltransferase
MNALAQTLEDGALCLTPFTDAHVEGLRAACDQDDQIWEIYPISLRGDHFDAAVIGLRARMGETIFAILDGGAVVGTTSYINVDAANHSLEIGGTFIAPSVRGTGFNRRMKALMINHALKCGFTRIEFRVDTRNGRSMAAVEKLGAQYEGTLRRNRITWTGYVRDTAIFALLADEWPGN